MTQKTFHLSTDQRSVIFGLSNAQAAATLAAVMVGYNVITGTDANGEPIRLLNESVLNGTILMILVTCTIASFAAQKGAHNIAAQDISDKEENKKESEHILIPVSNEETVEELVNLSLAIKSPQNKNGLFALKVIDNHHSDEKALKQSRRVLQTAVNTAAATDTRMKDLLRYDLSVSNAIASVVKEREITDLVVGLHKEKDIPAAFLGHIVESVLAESSVSTFIYKPAQPISTVRRHLIIIPELAEKEIGFNQIIFRLRNVTQNTGAATVFYGSEATLNALKKLLAKKSGEASYIEFNDWDDFLIVFRDIKPDDTMWIILSRKEGLSYAPAMARIPKYLNKYFQANSFVLAYPVQAGMNEGTRYLTYHYGTSLSRQDFRGEYGIFRLAYPRRRIKAGISLVKDKSFASKPERSRTSQGWFKKAKAIFFSVALKRKRCKLRPSANHSGSVFVRKANKAK